MWSSYRADGPDRETPTPEQLAYRRKRMTVPDNEFPVGALAPVLLASNDDAAVGVTHVEAFSTGFRFTLAVRVRQVPDRLIGGGLFTLVDGHGRPGAAVPLTDRLLLGIEYADGRRASTLQDARRPGLGGAVDDDELVLVPTGGGGGEASVDQHYWVAPLPPDGPLALHLTWPAFGMAESRTELDGGAIRAAGARSHVLWPPQPHFDAPPPPSPRPTSGWFADPPQ